MRFISRIVKLDTATLLLALMTTTYACGSGSAAQETEATISGVWASWDSIATLTQDTELIITGGVGPRIGRYEIVETDGTVAKADIVHAVQVEQVLKGNTGLEGQSIPVGYWDVDGRVENVTPLREGERLVLFLAAFKFGGQLDGWVPMASDTGVFEFLDPDTIVSRGVVGAIAQAELTFAELDDFIALGNT